MQAQKAGRQLSSLDVERLDTATEEHSKLQQQLFAKRKELRSHQSQQNDRCTDVSSLFNIKTNEYFPCSMSAASITIHKSPVLSYFCSDMLVRVILI